MPSLPRGTPTVIQQDAVAAHVVAGCREEGSIAWVQLQEEPRVCMVNNLVRRRQTVILAWPSMAPVQMHT